MQAFAIVIPPYFLHSNKRISTEKMPDEKTSVSWNFSRKIPCFVQRTFAKRAGFSELASKRGFTGERGDGR